MHPYQPNIRDKPRWRNRKHGTAQSASSAIRGANRSNPHINNRNALQLLRPTGGAKHRGRRNKSQPVERTHSHNRHLQRANTHGKSRVRSECTKVERGKIRSQSEAVPKHHSTKPSRQTRVGAENINHKANSRQHTAGGTPTNLQRRKSIERSKSAPT